MESRVVRITQERFYRKFVTSAKKKKGVAHYVLDQRTEGVYVDNWHTVVTTLCGIDLEGVDVRLSTPEDPTCTNCRQVAFNVLARDAHGRKFRTGN